MDKQQQRIAIAELVGFHCCGEYRVGRSGNQRVVLKGIHPRSSMQVELPNYPECLNACAEMRKSLSASQRVIFAEKLQMIWTSRTDRAIPTWWYIDASAADQSEAFLRVHGKWEGGQG